jgi:hypothetical protein
VTRTFSPRSSVVVRFIPFRDAEVAGSNPAFPTADRGEYPTSKPTGVRTPLCGSLGEQRRPNRLSTARTGPDQDGWVFRRCRGPHRCDRRGLPSPMAGRLRNLGTTPSAIHAKVQQGLEGLFMLAAIAPGTFGPRPDHSQRVAAASLGRSRNWWRKLRWCRHRWSGGSRLRRRVGSGSSRR